MARFFSEKLGEVEYDEDRVITFTEGLLGFPGLTRYILVERDQGPFAWLQSLEEPALAFAVADPWLFVPDYAPDIPDLDVEELGLTEPYNMSLFCVVTVPPDPEEASINLMGPVIVNLNSGSARQVALLNPEYSTRHRLLRRAPA